MLIETLGKELTDWDSLLAEYDADRTTTGRTLVDVSRRIGLYQVEQTPSWATMTPEDFHAWTAEMMSGDKLYLYQNLDDG